MFFIVRLFAIRRFSPRDQALFLPSLILLHGLLVRNDVDAVQVLPSSPLNYGLFTAAEAGSDGGQRFKPGRP